MDPDTHLLPLDAEELLEEIRSRHQRDVSGNGNHLSEAVRFYPLQPRSNGHVPPLPVLSDETFCESDYLLSNPDAAAAIERGEFRSGYDHWISCGKQEGRRFEPCEFSETDYLDLNPDVVCTVRDGTFASGRDHWLQRGRLEGRRVKKPLPLFTSRLTRLDAQLRAAVAGLEEDPPTPPTLRGRLGFWAISAIRRLLWWYTKPLKRFAAIADQGFREHTAVVEHLANLQEEQSRTLHSLESAIGGITEQLNDVVSQRLSERVERLSSMLLDFQAGTRALDTRIEFSFQALQQHLADEVLELKKRQHELRQVLDQRVIDDDISRHQASDELIAFDEKLNDFSRNLAASTAELNAGLEAETAARESLEQRLVSEISRSRTSGEIAALGEKLNDFSRNLAASTAELNAGLAAEMAARESLEQGLVNEVSRNQASDEIARLAESLHELGTQLGDSNARLLAGLAAEMGAREALAGKLEDLTREYEQLQLHCGAMQRYAEQTRADLTFHNARVGMFLKEARRRLPRPLQPEQLNRLTVSAQHEADALYVAFEDAFRGSREEVKQRQSIYLSYLATAQAGTPDQPVLDLGCGRGEWLELLRQHQLTGKGVDQNPVMLGICRALELDVVEADALHFIGNLPDSSLGAITAFHVIEHLPFDVLTALLDQALRVLRPGGLLILETPNPGNVMVGSQNFYLDPTHLKPLPIPMLRFFVEAKGFCNSQVLTLHPNPAAIIPLTSPTDSASRRLNELFSGPQDYAIIAQRP